VSLIALKVIQIRVAIWPFWNCLPEIKRFSHLGNFWPFFIFQDLAFFETTYGQIWPFLIFWTWQP
jgi:hypothetical protein